MPTELKRQQVEDLAQKLRQSVIVIATDFRGLPVNALSDLRRRLRASGSEYRVVKNTLTKLAAEQAGKPEIASLLEGPTGLVIGYRDPLEPAKALLEYIRSTRSSMVVRSAVLEGRTMTGPEVSTLTTLPSREELVARVMGQLQGPLASLVNVLSAPLRGLATVLERKVAQENAG
ncbi:MAG: 50S ribosomal protein L10 [Chloroflexi bacterium]|nr:50S ribosomal protein L10 [Chloroflexota bacterium]